MDKELKEVIEAELIAITKKHGITAASFIGMQGDKFIGMAVGKQTIITMFDATCCVGRMWQHMRGQVRTFLDKFEKEW